MVNCLCKRCGYEFSSVQSLEHHLKRKNTCHATKEDADPETLLQEILKQRKERFGTDYPFHCTLCACQYKTIQGLRKHQATQHKSTSTKERNTQLITKGEHQGEDGAHMEVITLKKQLLALCDRNTERFYQIILEGFLHGRHLNIDIVGITDVSTDAVHAEIKEWKSWKEALGQLLAYNKWSPRQSLHAYFFGKYLPTYKQKAIETLSVYGIKAFEFNLDPTTVSIVDLLTRETVHTKAIPASIE